MGNTRFRAFLKLAEAGMAGKFMFSFAFSAAAIFWADPRPEPRRAALVLLAVYAARTAGCLFNNLVDRQFDRKNPRTKARPLADGSASPRMAAAAIVLLSCVAAVCAFLLSPVYLLLLPAAVVPAFLYSYTKRFTWLCHGVLGVVCAEAPVASWIVFCDRLDARLVLLGAMVALWTAGYDILYSIQDAEFDRSEGLYSIPSRLGLNAAMRISEALHVLTIAVFYAWGVCLGFGFWYYAGAALCSCILIAEHALMWHGRYDRAPLAFEMNQWIGTVMLLFALAERWL